MGYVEGQNLVIESRSGVGAFEPLPALAAELVRLPVEVIVTDGTPPTLAARAATSTIPIVFSGIPDPVDRGLIASLAHPGGNITGAAGGSMEVNAGKQLELLKEVVPAATRIAVLIHRDHPLYGAAVQHLQAAARQLRVELYVMEVRDPATDLERAFATLAHERVDALCMLGDPSFTPYHTRIVELVAANRLPAIYLARPIVKAGGLMSYNVNFAAIARRVGVLVGKILRGATPADLPVEQPMQYHLAINLKTAKALGITIPPHLLVLADEVLQ